MSTTYHTQYIAPVMPLLSIKKPNQLLPQLRSRKIYLKGFLVHSLLKTTCPSIYHMHRTISCPYRIKFDQPKPIPLPSISAKTRWMSKKDKDEENKNPPHTEKDTSSSNTKSHPPSKRKEPDGKLEETPQKSKKEAIAPPLQKQLFLYLACSSLQFQKRKLQDFLKNNYINSSSNINLHSCEHGRKSCQPKSLTYFAEFVKSLILLNLSNLF